MAEVLSFKMAEATSACLNEILRWWDLAKEQCLSNEYELYIGRPQTQVLAEQRGLFEVEENPHDWAYFSHIAIPDGKVECVVLPISLGIVSVAGNPRRGTVHAKAKALLGWCIHQ